MGTVGMVWIRLRMSKATFTKPWEKGDKCNLTDKLIGPNLGKTTAVQICTFKHLSKSQYAHLLASNLAILDDCRSWGMDSQHGIVVVWIMLCICFICCYYGCRQRQSTGLSTFNQQLVRSIKSILNIRKPNILSTKMNIRVFMAKKKTTLTYHI